MISVDAATAATYHLVRPGGDFEQLLANIEGFLSIRSELLTRLPLLRLSFVMMKTNHLETEAFREKFSPLADYLAFQDYLNILGQPDTDLRVTSKDLTTSAQPFCPDPLTRLSVFADGSLFPCCSDFGRLNPLGSLWELGLEEAWKSQRAKFLATAEGRKTLECQKCFQASQSVENSDVKENKASFGLGSPWPLPLGALIDKNSTSNFTSPRSPELGFSQALNAPASKTEELLGLPGTAK
jgi:radical SAM protein with 4Fe4S-binding SPASM domain